PTAVCAVNAGICTGGERGSRSVSWLPDRRGSAPVCGDRTGCTFSCALYQATPPPLRHPACRTGTRSVTLHSSTLRVMECARAAFISIVLLFGLDTEISHAQSHPTSDLRHATLADWHHDISTAPARSMARVRRTLLRSRRAPSTYAGDGS